MAESNTLSYIDIALRFWAVAGPLIVGAIGAWWSRKNTIESRNHEDKRLTKEREMQLKVRKQELDDAQKSDKIERKRSMLLEKHHSLQEAAIKFLATTHEYSGKQRDFLNALSAPISTTNTQDRIDRKKDIATKALDEMSYYSQVIILLGDIKLSNSALSFWNAVTAVPRTVEGCEEEDYQQVLQTYKDSRLDFQVKVKSMLEKYEDELQSL